MTTPQLVVLWYAALLISAVFFLQQHSYSPWYSIGGIATLAAMLVFTLGNHPNAQKGKVTFWVAFPFLLTGILVGGWLGYDHYADWRLTQVVGPERVTISNLMLYANGKKAKTWNPGEACKSGNPAAEEDKRLFTAYILGKNQHDGFSSVAGCIENTAKVPLESMKIELIFREGAQTAHKQLIILNRHIPPGKTSTFIEALTSQNDLTNTEVSYSVIETRVSSKYLN